MAAESASAAGFLGATNARSARRDIVELAIGYALILATVWTPNPTQRILFWLSFLWLAATSWTLHESRARLGLGITGLVRSLWIVAAALVCMGLAIFAASHTHTLHPLYGSTSVLSHVWGYFIWAVMQQFLLQSYFLLRFMRLLPGRAAPIAAAASVFALAHLPNPVLTPITLLWGAASCMLFLRYRNVYTLGLAHGILGICVAVTVPNSLHHHMRVGLGYLRYHPISQNLLMNHYRSQIDQSVSTEACVIADAPTRRS